MVPNTQTHEGTYMSLSWPRTTTVQCDISHWHKCPPFFFFATTGSSLPPNDTAPTQPPLRGAHVSR